MIMASLTAYQTGMKEKKSGSRRRNKTSPHITKKCDNVTILKNRRMHKLWGFNVNLIISTQTRYYRN